MLSITQSAKSGSNDAQAACGDACYLSLEGSPGHCGIGPGTAISGAAEMFSSIFWTAYIPIVIVIATAVGRWLKEIIRQIHMDEWLRRSTPGQSLLLSPAAARRYARLRR